MGNNQSTSNNENEKKVKIIRIGNREEQGYIRLFLDDTVNYLDGEYNRIDCISRPPFTDYRVGDSLTVDLRVIRKRSNRYTFTDADLVILRERRENNTIDPSVVMEGITGVLGATRFVVEGIMGIDLGSSETQAFQIQRPNTYTQLLLPPDSDSD